MSNINFPRSISCQGFGSGGLARQKGMATLLVSIVILLIITLIVLFATKVGIFDLRMSGNESRYKEAFSAADGGLEYAIQEFAENITPVDGMYIYDCNKDGVEDAIPTPFLPTPTSPAPPCGSGTGSGLQLLQGGGLADATQPGFSTIVTKQTINGSYVYDFQVTGQAVDRSGSATVSQQVVFRGITGGKAPDTPIIADGSIDVSGNMNVVPNPNGSGGCVSGVNGCAVSVWTHDSVETGSSISTCQIQGFTGGQCPNPAQDPLHTQITNASDQGTDIVQNDNYTTESPAGNFPPDLFDYLFGVPKSNYQSIKAVAEADNQVYTNCDSLNASSKGLIWITGDCDIKGNTTVGSLENPVVLVVQDGQLSMNAGATIYGIVYAFDSPEAGTPTISSSGNVEIRGSLISDVDLDSGTGTFAVVWDPDVFNNILNNDDDAYLITATVPGSWSDF